MDYARFSSLAGWRDENEKDVGIATDTGGSWNGAIEWMYGWRWFRHIDVLKLYCFIIFRNRDVHDFNVPDRNHYFP